MANKTMNSVQVLHDVRTTEQWTAVGTTVIPKGSQVDIDILDVIPDCLRIKLALTGSLRTEESDDYSKVL